MTAYESPPCDIKVEVVSMKETSGKVTHFVQLSRPGADRFLDGMSMFGSVIKGRAEYHADEFRHLFGQGPRPNILKYDDTCPEDQKKFFEGPPPVTLDAISFWYESYMGPVLGTTNSINMYRDRRRKAAIDFAEKITKAFPGILTGGKS